MKKSIGKAAEFLRKAVRALRGKAAVLRARLLFLASLRRRMAVVAGISRQIRAITPRHGQRREKAAAEGEESNHVVGLPELARLFEQVANLFDDDEGDERRRAAGGVAVVDGLDDVDEDGDDGSPSSVIDVIRRRREGEGQEFRIEDEIDQAADMYINRVRRRIMNAQNGACVASGRHRVVVYS